MEMTSRVREIIKPSSVAPQTSVALNSLDQNAPPWYVVYLLFFKNFPVSSRHLKLSLSKTLSLFYPLAGRYRARPDQGLMEIDCCDQGIEFIEAFASKSLDEVFPSFHEVNPSLASLVSCDRVTADLENAPFLSIQLTRFHCSGACLQVAAHHIAVDGMATAYFLQAWGKFSSGQESFVHPPHLDRSLPQPDMDHTIPSDSVPPEFQIDGPLLDICSPGSRADQTILAFSNSSIQSMLETDHGKVSATRFEILVAHLWIAVTRSRANLSIVSPHQQTKLGFTVDARKRFDPPLPEGFLGNAFLVAIATTTVENLLEHPIDYAVTLIQAAKAQMTHPSMAATAAWIESKKVYLTLSPGTADFMVSSWQRLGMGSVDFGCGIKPAFIGTWDDLLPGMCLLLPEIEGDDRLVALLSLDAQQMKAMKNTHVNSH